MIKIAFFLDDAKIKQTFSELDYSKIPLTLIGFFKKDKGEIEKIAKFSPNIIMTDDSFSDMKEEEFISEIKEMFSRAVFIKFGTSNSFENIRKAFKLGYSDYVTLDDYMSDHYEMLADIVASNNFADDYHDYNSRIKREKDLLDYAFGTSDRMLQKHNIDPENVYVASLSMLNFDDVAKDDWAYEKELLLFAFKNILNELFDSFENGEFFFNYYSQIFIVFTPSDVVDKEYVKNAVKMIADTLLTSLGMLSFSVVCDEPIKLCNFMDRIYNEMVHRTWVHFIAPGYVYFESEIDEEFVEDFNAPRMLNKFEGLIDNLDFEGFAKEIRNLDKIRPRRKYIHDVNEFTKNIYNTIRHFDVQNQIGLVKENDIVKLLNSYKLDIAIEYFICCIYAISDYISEDRYVSIQINKFLQDHLADNITLKDISETFNFEYTYTSKYFTQIMGMPFKKYFNNLRLSTAINLLKTSDMKCYEIASKCGYNNYEHFSRIFYKKYEMWPKEVVRPKKR